MKTLRKYHEIGPSKGEGAIIKKQAEVERDKVLAKLNAPTPEVAVQQVASTGVALFGQVARMYKEGYLARPKWKHVNLAAATIKIEQRVWHQEIGRPKSEDSRRVLGIGDLADRFPLWSAGRA